MSVSVFFWQAFNFKRIVGYASIFYFCKNIYYHKYRWYNFFK